MDNYSGYFLCSGNGANADYISGSVAARPGATLQYANGSEKNTLLAGGFSSVHPGSSFALSPTLQLNGDLTEIDDAQMLALARAELIRHNSQSFRSYSLEADLRMTVIGASAESLKKFMDTYGGVLEIDPILIKGYDPELTTALELQLSSLKNNIQISFSVRHAVDLSRCTYCGACGPACPEHCISEQLFLDFSHCNFCKECLEACPHDAIDLHAVERRELVTPAILLLDGTSIDLPEQQKNIYSEESLPDFFASRYATEVDEVIGWDSSICQYSARLGTGCTVCSSACLHEVVTQGPEGVQIDQRACVECGACLGSCPTGALKYKRFDDVAFVEYFRTFPLTPGTRVVLGEEEELHKYWWHSKDKKHEQVFFMEYPTVNALHTMHLLLLYAMGAKQILVLEEAGSGLESQIKLSNALLHALFKNDRAIILTNRHELDTILDQNEEAESLSRVYHDFSYGNRRKKLISLLLYLREQSEAEPEPERIATKYFGEIICDEEKCTQCIACVNDCRMEALVADSASYSLKHTPVQCVQCGICVTVCPERALTMKSGLAVQDTFFTENVASQAEPAKCKGCGKVFGTRKALERVMAILSSKNIWDSDDDLLSYCEDCRVVNLYESSEKV